MSSWMLRLFARKKASPNQPTTGTALITKSRPTLAAMRITVARGYAETARLVDDVAGEPLGGDRADAGDDVQHRVCADPEGCAGHADRGIEQTRQRDQSAAGRLDLRGGEDLDVGAWAHRIAGGGVAHRILPEEMRHRKRIRRERVRHHRPVLTIRGARTPVRPIGLGGI